MPTPPAPRAPQSRQMRHFINCILNTCFKLVKAVSLFGLCPSHLSLWLHFTAGGSGDRMLGWPSTTPVNSQGRGDPWLSAPRGLPHHHPQLPFHGVLPVLRTVFPRHVPYVHHSLQAGAEFLPLWGSSPEEPGTQSSEDTPFCAWRVHRRPKACTQATSSRKPGPQQASRERESSGL